MHIQLKNVLKIKALLGLLIISSCSTGDEYIEVHGIAHFYSVTLTKNNRLKLVLSPVSIPALEKYKEEKQQIFYLNSQEHVQIALDESEERFYKFKFIEYKNGYIYGSEKFISKEFAGMEPIKIRFKQFPRMHASKE